MVRGICCVIGVVGVLMVGEYMCEASDEKPSRKCSKVARIQEVWEFSSTGASHRE